MARINHRAAVRAGTSKRRPSKRCRKGSMKFWRNKALKAAKVTDKVTELEKQLNKVEGEKSEVEEQLAAVREELQGERRRYRELQKRAKREKNAVVRAARGRWEQRTRELKEGYEQQLEETRAVLEEEVQKRLDAEFVGIGLEAELMRLRREQRGN